MQFDVTVDRDKYIGGSDVDDIMELNPNAWRWDLLKFKAGLSDNNFKGNAYTEYGNDLEPKIREYVNLMRGTDFEPDQRIVADMRANVDGWDESAGTILEIKTTSHVFKELQEYKAYLVQLVFYMEIYAAPRGILAVYERPDDFSTDFEPERLTVYDIDAGEKWYKDMKREISYALEVFRCDLEFLRANPFADNSELPSNAAIAPYTNEILQLEAQMADYKALERRYKQVKTELYEAMSARGIKRWILPGGTKATLVEPGADHFEWELNIEALKRDCPTLVDKYSEPQLKRGRAGYVKITPGELK